MRKPSVKTVKLPVLDPGLQVSFYYKLQTIRDLCLDHALGKTIKEIELPSLDAQLTAMVSPDMLKKVASFGLRGELFFAVPCVLEANPCLLGYYRLLLGLSQKEFYNKGPFGRFKALEERGDIPDKIAPLVPALCASLTGTAQRMVAAIDNLSLSIVNDLQLLTLGPQLRGGENTTIGKKATREVFTLIQSIVAKYVKEVTNRTIVIENDSGRMVLVEFSSDPDIRITQKLPTGVRPVVSIEIKGGADASNIHNRLGEAEKSHQKAKARGFFEFWTILRVDLAEAVAKRESPTTSHFFNLNHIRNSRKPDFLRFREILTSILGIRL